MARKDDVKTMDSLHARCTRLLAMLSFVYPIRKVGASYTLRNIEILEFELRSTGQGLRVLSHSTRPSERRRRESNQRRAGLPRSPRAAAGEVLHGSDGARGRG